MQVNVLDSYYLAITLLITIAYQLFFFSIAFSFKFDKLTGPSLVDRALYFLANQSQTLLAAPTLSSLPSSRSPSPGPTMPGRSWPRWPS